MTLLLWPAAVRQSVSQSCACFPPAGPCLVWVRRQEERNIGHRSVRLSYLTVLTKLLAVHWHDGSKLTTVGQKLQTRRGGEGTGRLVCGRELWAVYVGKTIRHGCVCCYRYAASLLWCIDRFRLCVEQTEAAGRMFQLVTRAEPPSGHQDIICTKISIRSMLHSREAHGLRQGHDAGRAPTPAACTFARYLHGLYLCMRQSRVLMRWNMQAGTTLQHLWLAGAVAHATAVAHKRPAIPCAKAISLHAR